MNTKRKGLAILGLTVGLSICGSFAAFAENSRIVIGDDGNLTVIYDYRSEWVWRDPDKDGIEECYYFDEVGELVETWVQDNVVQQRHAADGTPVTVSVSQDEGSGKKIFNVEGIEIISEIPAKTNYTWVQGGWVGNAGVGKSTGTNSCTVDDMNLLRCDYTTIFINNERQKVLAATFIINGKMTERNNSRTGYIGGHYNFFNTETKEEYRQGPGGVRDEFISGKTTLEEAVRRHSSTKNLEVGDTYYTDITLYIPVGVTSCTLQFYEK